MFIVVEGIDGSGKTTFIKLLKELLEKKQPTIITREPFQGKIYDLIKDILSKGNEYKSTLPYLFMADRDFHIRNFILPELLNNKIVISDRYLASTMAYQSDSDFSINKIYNLHKISNFLIPDLMIYLNGNLTDSLNRINKRGERDFVEEPEYLGQVLEKYKDTISFLEAKGWHTIKIDSNQNTDPSVLNNIVKIILEINQELLLKQ